MGRRVAERALEAGARVVGVTRDDQALVDGVLWRRCDLTDSDAVRALMDEEAPDFVLHLAGAPFAAQKVEHLLTTFDANLRATVVVAEAMLRRGGTGRLVTMGSMEEPSADEGAESVMSPYAASKWASTLYTQLCYERFGLEWANLRVFTVYGPRQQLMNKLVPATILAAARGERPWIGSPERWMDFVYIDDVADAVLAAAVRREALGRTIEIGSGEAITVAELAAKICQRTNPAVAPRLGSGDNVNEVVRRADIQDAERYLNWRPSLTLEEGLDRTIEWYRTLAEPQGIADSAA